MIKTLVNKKNAAIIGAALSLVIILFGILVLSGAFGAKTEKAPSSSSKYDTGYATFGADFYNFASNNAYEAAVATRAVADNLHALGKLIKNVSGLTLLALGFLGCGYFGLAFVECLKKEESPAEAGAATHDDDVQPDASENE